ncbi:hypothetical protein QUF70_10695 [Desulfobacterales bacterium HSG17]|nr:hypothetical protein [Desulfobacterales bacterium HSG17]
MALNNITLSDLHFENLFEKLRIIDPDLTDSLMAIIKKKKTSISFHETELLEQETIWGMCQDIELGTLIARGYASLRRGVTRQA